MDELQKIKTYVCYKGADVLATYGSDFYAGRLALTVNSLGEGKAYYVASRDVEPFNGVFFDDETCVKPVIDTKLPAGVTAQVRRDDEYDYVLVMNSFILTDKCIQR